MKRLRVPIDRHANGLLTEVLRKIVLVMPSPGHAHRDGVVGLLALII
jgi:hypothetical protein